MSKVAPGAAPGDPSLKGCVGPPFPPVQVNKGVGDGPKIDEVPACPLPEGPGLPPPVPNA